VGFLMETTWAFNGLRFLKCNIYRKLDILQSFWTGEDPFPVEGGVCACGCHGSRAGFS
jgi:hypothetical protein